MNELTARHREVLALVAQAMTNRQIAHRLGISESTVKGHLRTMYERMEVDSRTEAALTFVRAEARKL